MRRFERWAPWLPPLFVVGLFLPSLLQPGIIHPPLPRLSDATRQIYLWREFWRDEILDGRLPLWNPFLYVGTPFLGELQSAVFYPLNGLFLLFSPDAAFKLHALASLAVAGYFMYRLCRLLGASRGGAALGSLAFAANGQFVLFVFAGWINHLSVASWAPAVLWAFLEAQRGGSRRRMRYLVLGASFLVLQAFGGHPEWMMYTLIAVLALAVGRWSHARSHGEVNAGGRPWLAIGVVGMVAVLLSAPQLLPAIEATLESSRGQAALSGAAGSSTGAFPALLLPAAVVPRLFGPYDFSVSVDAWPLRWLGRHVTIADCLMYVGLVPLVLAPIGARFGSAMVSPRVWLALGLGGLLLALNTAGLWSAVGWLIPLTQVFRNPARFVFLLSLSVCVLASLGATRLLDGRFNFGRRFRLGLNALAALMAVAGLACLAAVGWASDLARLVPLGRLAGTIAARRLDVGELAALALRSMGGQLLLAGGLLLLAVRVLTNAEKRPSLAGWLLAITALDLALFAWPFMTSVERPQRLYAADRRLLDTLEPQALIHVTDESLLTGGPNVFLEARRRSSGGYDSFRLRDYDELAAVAEATTDPQAFWAAVGVRYWMEPAPGAGAEPGAWRVTELARPTPPFYWTDRIEVAADRADALRRLPEINRSSPPAVLLTADQARRQPRSLRLAVEPRITTLSDQPGRQTVSLTTASPGWLVKSEMFYPGWRADVDGVWFDVARVNGIMQGIPLAAGSHQVSFVYAPRSLEYGLAAFAIGLVLALALLVWSYWPVRPGTESEVP